MAIVGTMEIAININRFLQNCNKIHINTAKSSCKFKLMSTIMVIRLNFDMDGKLFMLEYVKSNVKQLKLLTHIAFTKVQNG